MHRRQRVGRHRYPRTRGSGRASPLGVSGPCTGEHGGSRQHGRKVVTLPALLTASRSEIPMWALRPGSVAVLRPAAPGMQLWALVRSCNGKEMLPCFASESTLSQSLGFSGRGAVRLRLARLREVPGLLLEIPLGRAQGEKTLRPYLRWATDPTRRGYWYRVIEAHRLPKCAENFGLGPHWIEDAMRTLNRHNRAAERLARELFADCLDAPCSDAIQDAGGRGRDGRTKPTRRRKRVGRKARR